MKQSVRIAIVVVLIVIVGSLIVFKQTGSPLPVTADAAEETKHEAGEPLPRLLDLGADKCIPCKMMMPILENLKEAYKGRLDVEFIDVWKHPEAAVPYNINLIPTQIFFDKDGKELFRHEGFFSREDILSKWEELGVELREPAG